MTTNSDELERTIGSDPVLSSDVHAATIKLARDLASQLDKQIAETGTGESRTIATYAGQLSSLRRIVRDERDRRRKENSRPERSASRLALIKSQAGKSTHAREKEAS